jgi:CRISPR-associated protein Cas10/Csm1 subtype III-A
MIQDVNLYKVIIGAYLHDMGKLLWRGGYSRSWTWYKIAHAQYLVDFFHNKWKFCYTWWVSETRKEISRLASYHHARDYFDNHWWMKTSIRDRAQATELQQQLAWIIYMWDNLWSQDRKNRIDDQEWEEREYIKHVWLTSIFENIFIEEDIDPEKTQRWYSKTYLPSKVSDEIKFVDKWYWFDEEEKFMQDRMKHNGNTAVSEWFKTLADWFIVELKHLINQYVDINDGELLQVWPRLISQLDILTQQYFSFVPSDAYKSIGDISLYDHTKMVVANSVLLYNMMFKEKKIFTLKENTEEINAKEMILIAGDFPSIQSFIHQSMTTNKGLAKRLRARSLIIQLLNEAVIQFILDNLQLPRANVLLNVGGKFVIAWNTFHKESITHLSTNINNYLITHYGASIKINLYAQSFCINDIFDLDGWKWISECIASLFENLTKNKYQLYSKNNLKLLFDKKAKFEGINMRYGDNEWNPKESIIQEKILWQEIVKHTWPSICINYKNNSDFTFDFIKVNDKTIWNEQWELLTAWQLEIRINNREIDQQKQKNEIILSWSVHCISKSINRYVPKNMTNEIKDFEKIIKEDQNNQNYLTMIKGDVDFMSLILKHGFGSIYSLSRLVQFSRYLELFFWAKTEEWLNKTNIYQNVYTIFSGWDDFVFIVPFQQRIKFIQEYIEKFHCFVAQNPSLHFSVGMCLFKDKTPLRYVDAECEKILKQAKKISKKNFQITTTEKYLWDLSCFWLGLYSPQYIVTNTLREPIQRWIDHWDWFLEIKTYIWDLWDTKIYQIYIMLGEVAASRNCNNYIEFHLLLARLIELIKKWNNTNKLFDYLQEKILTVNTLNPGEIIKNIQKLRLKCLHYLTSN